MPSYIEAGALLMELNDTDIFDTYNDYSMVFDTIDNFPTADVEPVVHSSWEIVKTGDGCFDYYFRCKHCHGNTPDKAYIISPDYCPNCGAKMDGDTNGS